MVGVAGVARVVSGEWWEEVGSVDVRQHEENL